MKGWTKDVIGPGAAQTLDGLLRERVHRTPDRPAYQAFDRDSAQWRTLTWAEVAAQVGRWQRALAGEGLHHGERVALALRNSPEWVFFDQAALGLGLVTVPLYVDDRPDNVAHILQDSGARVLLLQDAAAWRRLGPHLSDAHGLRRVLLLSPGRPGEASAGPAGIAVSAVSEWLPAATSTPVWRDGDPEALASIVYTSGTTGRPKGVMLSHRNITSVAQASLETMDCYREDVFLSFLPLSHTLERTAGYYLPLATGSCVVFSRSVQQLGEDLLQARPTVMIAVPRIFERFYSRIQQQLEKAPAVRRRLFRWTLEIGWRRFQVQQGRADWSPALLLWPLLQRLVAAKVLGRMGGRLRIAVSGGAALPMPVARLFLGLGLPVLQGYGLTETSPVISVNTLANNDPASVGPPLPGIDLRIAEDGELLVRGPGVMLGYWNNPEATRQVLGDDGWLRTGDKVEIREGRIYITGRLKDILVLSNGENVPPVDMEVAITLDDLFDQAMVVGEGRAFLSAVLVLNPEEWVQLAGRLGLDPQAPSSLEHPEVVAAAQSRVDRQLRGFPGYAKIRRLVLSTEAWTVDNGLLTPTLKVKRSKVLEGFRPRIEKVYEEGPAGARRRVA
jgi:long-chain acyl-CoA synthetase